MKVRFGRTVIYAGGIVDGTWIDPRKEPASWQASQMHGVEGGRDN
jgi:hypothetical protein